MNKTLLASITAFTLTGCATVDIQEVANRLYAMTPTDFAKRTTVKNDPMSEYIIVSSLLGWEDDIHLIYTKNKNTGKESYGVGANIEYHDDRARRYKHITTIVDGGKIQRLPFRQIGSDVNCRTLLSDVRRGICQHSEHRIAYVTREFLQTYANMFDQSKRQYARFSFRAQNGPNQDRTLVLQEISGFLKRVNSLRGFTQTKTSATQ